MRVKNCSRAFEYWEITVHFYITVCLYYWVMRIQEMCPALPVGWVYKNLWFWNKNMREVQRIVWISATRSICWVWICSARINKKPPVSWIPLGSWQNRLCGTLMICQNKFTSERAWRLEFALVWAGSRVPTWRMALAGWGKIFPTEHIQVIYTLEY